MIRVQNTSVKVGHFPDNTQLIKFDPFEELYFDHIEDWDTQPITIDWIYESDEELITLMYLTQHLRSHGFKDIRLFVPYLPNARQDRVKTDEDVFTLKYFAQMINWLNFNRVTVLDPHSNVSIALIDRIDVLQPRAYIQEAFRILYEDKNEWDNKILVFFPDEGSMKRYSEHFDGPYVYGNKVRDFATGKIKSLQLCGDVELIKDARILIIDDICSRGGTFIMSAEALKKAGAKEVNLYVTHCENNALTGNLFDNVNKVFTTKSIVHKPELAEKVIYVNGDIF